MNESKTMPVLDYISRKYLEDGVPPTFEEIANHFQFKSKRAVSFHVEKLIVWGMVRKLESRNVIVPNGFKVIKHV